MIVGASSSNIHPVDIAKLSLFDGLSRRAEDPQGACRPFDFDRDGTIVGEGGAAFVVERYNHAVRRGAKIYAEVFGVAAGCDGTGFSNGAGGTGLVRAVRSGDAAGGHAAVGAWGTSMLTARARSGTTWLRPARCTVPSTTTSKPSR